MPEFTIYTETDRPGSADVPPFVVGDSTSWAIRFERPDGTLYAPSSVSVRVGHINGLPDASYPSAFTWADRCGNEHVAGITVTSGVPVVSWGVAPTGGVVGADGVYILRGQIPDGRVIDFQANAKLLTLNTNEELSQNSTNINFQIDGRTVATGRITWGQAAYDIRLVVTAPGSGYTSAPAVVFTGGGGTGMAATALLDEFGGVSALTLTSLGSGYTSAPVVSFSGGGGSGATAAAEFVSTAAGKLKTAFVTNAGSGYSSAPTVTLSDETGTGGQIAATGWDTVSAITITNPGSGYTSAPTASFSGGGGTGAAATVAVGTVGRATFTGTGNLWVAPGDSFTETIQFSGGSTPAAITVTFKKKTFPSAAASGTSGAASTEVAYVSIGGISVTSPGSGYTVAPTVSRYGFTFTGVLQPTITITNPGSGYTSAPSISFSGGGGIGLAATAVVGRITDLEITSAGSGYTTAPTLAISGGGGTGATGRVTIDPVKAVYRIVSTELLSSTRNATSTPEIIGEVAIKNTVSNTTRSESAKDYIGTINVGAEVAETPYKRAESSAAIVGAVRLTSYSDGRYNGAGQLQYDHSALVVLPRTIASANFTTGTDSAGAVAAVGTLNPINAHVTARLAMRRATTLDIQVYGDGRMLFQGALSVVQRIA